MNVLCDVYLNLSIPDPVCFSVAWSLALFTQPIFETSQVLILILIFFLPYTRNDVLAVLLTKTEHLLNSVGHVHSACGVVSSQ